MKDKEMIEEMANVPTKEEIEARNKRGKEKDELTQALLHYATAEASGGIKSLIDCEGCAFYLYEILDYRKLPKDSVVLSREVLNERWIDLLTEFDEMGFEPTTLPPNDMSVEEYTAFYKDRLLMCLAKASKETTEKILNKVYWLVAQKDVINVLTRIKEIATREGVEIKE